MASLFPATNYDTFTPHPNPGDMRNNPSLADKITLLEEAALAIQETVGITDDATVTTHDYQIKNHVHDGGGGSVKVSHNDLDDLDNSSDLIVGDPDKGMQHHPRNHTIHHGTTGDVSLGARISRVGADYAWGDVSTWTEIPLADVLYDSTAPANEWTTTIPDGRLVLPDLTGIEIADGDAVVSIQCPVKIVLPGTHPGGNAKVWVRLRKALAGGGSDITLDSSSTRFDTDDVNDTVTMKLTYLTEAAASGDGEAYGDEYYLEVRSSWAPDAPAKRPKVAGTSATRMAISIAGGLA